MPRCVYLCVAHQSQCLCQQKDLSRLEEMAWKDSNDLSSLTFPYGADFFPSVLVVLSATLLPFCFLNLSVHTLLHSSNHLTLSYHCASSCCLCLLRRTRCCGGANCQSKPVRCVLWQRVWTQLPIQEQWRWNLYWCGTAVWWEEHVCFNTATPC